MWLRRRTACRLRFPSTNNKGEVSAEVGYRFALGPALSSPCRPIGRVDSEPSQAVDLTELVGDAVHREFVFRQDSRAITVREAGWETTTWWCAYSSVGLPSITSSSRRRPYRDRGRVCSPTRRSCDLHTRSGCQPSGSTVVIHSVRSRNADGSGRLLDSASTGTSQAGGRRSGDRGTVVHVTTTSLITGLLCTPPSVSLYAVESALHRMPGPCR